MANLTSDHVFKWYGLCADNIAENVRPIVDLIHETKPNYIIALDTGARLVGLATFMMHRQLYGRLPTVDGSIRFRRWSSQNERNVLEESIRPIINEAIMSDKRNFLIIDDVVSSGGTIQEIFTSIDEMSHGCIRPKIAVVSQYSRDPDIKPDFISNKSLRGDPEWTDDGKVIGVGYLRNLEPVLFRGNKPLEYRRKVRDNILGKVV